MIALEWFFPFSDEAECIDEDPERTGPCTPGLFHGFGKNWATENLVAAPARERLEGLDEGRLLGVGQICFVSQSIAAMLPPGGWGPHGASKFGLSAVWNQLRSGPFKRALQYPAHDIGRG
jgi:hypothetical protein